MVGEGWDDVSDLGKTFLKDLLQVEPKRRLSAEHALSHPWISGSGPSFDRRLSSLTGLAVIASMAKKQVTKAIVDAAEGRPAEETADIDVAGAY